MQIIGSYEMTLEVSYNIFFFFTLHKIFELASSIMRFNGILFPNKKFKHPIKFNLNDI